MVSHHWDWRHPARSWSVLCSGNADGWKFLHFEEKTVCNMKMYACLNCLREISCKMYAPSFMIYHILLCTGYWEHTRSVGEVTHYILRGGKKHRVMSWRQGAWCVLAEPQWDALVGVSRERCPCFTWEDSKSPLLPAAAACMTASPVEKHSLSNSESLGMRNTNCFLSEFDRLRLPVSSGGYWTSATKLESLMKVKTRLASWFLSFLCLQTGYWLTWVCWLCLPWKVPPHPVGFPVGLLNPLQLGHIPKLRTQNCKQCFGGADIEALSTPT